MPRGLGPTQHSIIRVLLFADTPKDASEIAASVYGLRGDYSGPHAMPVNHLHPIHRALRKLAARGRVAPCGRSSTARLLWRHPAAADPALLQAQRAAYIESPRGRREAAAVPAVPAPVAIEHVILTPAPPLVEDAAPDIEIHAATPVPPPPITLTWSAPEPVALVAPPEVVVGPEIVAPSIEPSELVAAAVDLTPALVVSPPPAETPPTQPDHVVLQQGLLWQLRFRRHPSGAIVVESWPSGASCLVEPGQAVRLLEARAVLTWEEVRARVPGAVVPAYIDIPRGSIDLGQLSFCKEAAGTVLIRALSWGDEYRLQPGQAVRFQATHTVMTWDEVWARSGPVRA